MIVSVVLPLSILVVGFSVIGLALRAWNAERCR